MTPMRPDPARQSAPDRRPGRWTDRRQVWVGPLGMGLALILATAAQAPALPTVDPLTGPRTPLNKDWIGLRPLPTATPILVMAGHADSQGIAGAGTSGEAVDRLGAAPMEPGITDELFWNLRVAERVVALGRERGLTMGLYVPTQRSIADGNDPRTNWSVGKDQVRQGVYALEIHFDAYGRDGFGSGLIPPLLQPPSRVDERLAEAFGAYPSSFRDGLGAPKRGIAILEIGKLEHPLETALRNPESRAATINAIAARVVQALALGLEPAPTTLGTASPLSPRPGGAGSAARAPGLSASSGAE